MARTIRRSGRKAGNGALTLSPGREATSEQLAKWEAEIVRFISVVESHKLNILGGADYVRRHHPLSDEAVAWLAWWAKEKGVIQYISEATTHAAKALRIRDALAGIILCLLYDSPEDDTASVFTKFRAMINDAHPYIQEVAADDSWVRWQERPLSREGGERVIETSRADIANRISRRHDDFRKYGREYFAAKVAKLKKLYSMPELD
jgi:hypothetical protein